jgi:hypothetical protein
MAKIRMNAEKRSLVLKLLYTRLRVPELEEVEQAAHAAAVARFDDIYDPIPAEDLAVLNRYEFTSETSLVRVRPAGGGDLRRLNLNPRDIYRHHMIRRRWNTDDNAGCATTRKIYTLRDAFHNGKDRHVCDDTLMRLVGVYMDAKLATDAEIKRLKQVLRSRVQQHSSVGDLIEEFPLAQELAQELGLHPAEAKPIVFAAEDAQDIKFD